MDNNEKKIEGEALTPQEDAEIESEDATEEHVESEVAEEDSSASEDIDFAAELEKERERLGKKVDKERTKRIEAERNSIPKEEVEKIVGDRINQLQKQMLRERAEIIAERMAKTPEEKELIILHYDNHIVPTGNLTEDMEMARALANRKKVAGQLSEIRKAAESKQTIQKGGSGSGAPIETKPTKRYSQDIIDGAKFAGKTPEEFAKMLEK
jgi:hypothetical protein